PLRPHGRTRAAPPGAGERKENLRPSPSAPRRRAAAPPAGRGRVPRPGHPPRHAAGRGGWRDRPPAWGPRATSPPDAVAPRPPSIWRDCNSSPRARRARPVRTSPALPEGRRAMSYATALPPTARYTATQRWLHWLVVALLLVQVGLGIWIAYYAPEDEAAA